MSGRVIRSLRASRLAPSLTEAEMMALANCGRMRTYATGQGILRPADESLCVLERGRVQLQVTMYSEHGDCGGEAMVELAQPGEPFGWSFWVRPDRIAVSARALEPVSLGSFDLSRLNDSETFRKISLYVVRCLYGWLQETGLCPPNIQAYLKLKHTLEL